MRFSIDFNQQSVDNLIELLRDKKISFQEIVDKTKKCRAKGKNFKSLLSDEWFFDKLIREKLISNDDLKYLFDKIDKLEELQSFDKNKWLFRPALKRNAVQFNELLDKYVSIEEYPCLSWIVKYENDRLNWLLDNNLVSVEDCKHLLDQAIKTKDYFIVRDISRNKVFLRKCFKNFLITDYVVENFNMIIDQHRVVGFFRYIKDWHKDTEKFLKIADDYERFGMLISGLNYTIEEKHELLNIIRNSEKAKNNLIQFIRDNLESAFENFEELKRALIKDTNKKKLTLNI